VEQGEAVPATSAVAQNVVLESSGTETVSPVEENVAASPVAATADVQPEFVYRRTVDPDAAFPITAGELAFAGDGGETAVNVGAGGSAAAVTRRTRWFPKSLR
jgi:hypothetical protein